MLGNIIFKQLFYFLSGTAGKLCEQIVPDIWDLWEWLAGKTGDVQGGSLLLEFDLEFHQDSGEAVGSRSCSFPPCRISTAVQLGMDTGQRVMYWKKDLIIWILIASWLSWVISTWCALQVCNYLHTTWLRSTQLLSWVSNIFRVPAFLSAGA